MMLSKIIPTYLGNNVRRLASTSSIDASELQHFKQFSEEWWNETGHLRALHSMNKVRVPLIRNGLTNVSSISLENINSPTPLKGLSILDVGCGGGILSEPLARIGGIVTGLDANCDLVEKAKSHAKMENLENICYLCSSVEEHANNNENKYDAIVASEIVEHVSEKQTFLKACIQCLKPGGSIFLTTISKTCLANFAGILLAENLLQLLPKGTHQYDKFIKPHKLQRILEEENCKTVLVHGLLYNFMTNEWFWSPNNDVNYAVHAVKLCST